MAGSAKDTQLGLASDQALFKLLPLTTFSQLRDERVLSLAFGVSGWCCAVPVALDGAKHPSLLPCRMLAWMDQDDCADVAKA